MKPTREEVDDRICEIMMSDGPDGHVDGHDKITDQVMEWLEQVKNE